MAYTRNYSSPLGNLVLTASDKGLASIQFREEVEETYPERLLETAQQLTEFFEGDRKSFKLPLDIEGTPYQQKCWEALQAIPYGETRTYKEQAVSVASEAHTRAVASANNKNRIPIVIPCHRIIGSDGSLTGFAWGVEAKKYLLDLEQRCREDSRHL